MICQSTLRVISDLFRLDYYRHLESIAFNDYMITRDPATGQDSEVVLVTATIRRTDLDAIQLAGADATAWLRRSHAQQPV